MIGEITGSGSFVLLPVLLLTVGIPLWAVADALSRPASAFYDAGSNKTAWIMVLIVTLVLGFGFFLGCFYLISVRRKVRLHALSG